MKKTLFTMAALAALPTVATSADVTMYGLLDLGLAFYNVDPGVQGGGFILQPQHAKRSDGRQPNRHARL